MNKLVDLSHTIEDGMPVFPGDGKTNLFQTKYLSMDKHNNHRLDISMHAGTHIDAPMHLTESREYISEVPLDSFIGDGCVLDVRNQPVIQMKAEYEAIVKEKSIVLLCTGQDRFYGRMEYYEEHPVMGLEFCEFLLKKKVKMIGMDMPSPDRYPFPVHKLFLKNRIYIIENLTNLDKLLAMESFEIMAFPLKIKADGSMARVVARSTGEFYR